MFAVCSSLSILPAGFTLPDVPNGTSSIFSTMFSYCSSLSSLPAGFTLPAVPNGTSSIFYRMFYNCSSLSGLPAGFTLPEVPNGTSSIFSYMFYGCSSLGSLPAGFTLPAVPNGGHLIFDSMFYNCGSLAANINDLISGPIMNAARLNGFYNMLKTFCNCSSLTGSALTAISIGFGGATPSDDRSTFEGCTGLSDYNSIPANWR
jgi:hypothetical protein